MNFDDYQKEAKSTSTIPPDIQLFYFALGLNGEAGEVAEEVKKLFRDHHGEITEDFRTRVKLEIGDVLWYCAMVLDTLEISLNDAALSNVDKLKTRYKKD